VITEKTTSPKKEKLLVDYDNRLASYESRFHAYRTWLDEDAHAGSVLTASMENHFTADIVEFERTYQMWPFLHQKYESTGQSTYLAAIRQEQLLRQSDTKVDDFFISFPLFGVRLILLALGYLQPLVSVAEIRRLHLSFIGLMTF
jgi:hypothetical protein